MSKKVKLRAYVEGNLGDDLFLEIICGRYPHTNFYLCGSKKYNKIYSLIPNLKFVFFDSICIRIMMALQRKFANTVNRILRTEKIQLRTTDFAIEEKYSRKADYNVFITGSGFMNNQSEFESLKKKYVDEKKYYDRKPYVIGCNFGPYAHEEYLEMYRELFQSTSDLCFRDRYSLSLFPKVKHARCASDVVFAYPLKNIKVNMQNEKCEYLLISVANIKKDKDSAMCYYEKYVNMLKDLICSRNARSVHTVLVGFSNTQGDHETIKEVLEGIEDLKLNHTYCYPDSANCQKILELFMNATAVVATRYHAMILALLMNKRCCTICYNEKIKHVIQDIDAEAKFIELAELERVTTEQIESEKMYQITEKKRLELIESAERQFEELDKILK